MKKRILAMVLALGMTAGLLAGCGGSGGSESTDTSASSESEGTDSEESTEEASGNTEVKPALLLSGSASDHSWNQFGYEALMSVQDELGVEVTYSEMFLPWISFRQSGIMLQADTIRSLDMAAPLKTI